MTVIPELREQLVAAMTVSAQPRDLRPRLFAALVASGAVAAVVAIAVALTTAAPESERPASPPPGDQDRWEHTTLPCAAGYDLHEQHFREQRAYGSLSGWRARAVTVGPITILNLAAQADEPAWKFALARERARHEDRHWAEQLIDNGADRYAAFGTNVLVEPHGTVTVAVPPEARGHVGLLTDLPRFGGYLPEDGRTSITYEGCEPRVDDSRDDEQQGIGYPLAIIVAGARCVPLDITPKGKPTVRRVVSFGAGRCPE